MVALKTYIGGRQILKERTMLYCDSHTHSFFSDDSKENPRNTVEAAITKGLKYIALTDHADPAHPEGYLGVTEEDLPLYIETMTALKKEYLGRINVTVGLEMGYLKSGVKTAQRMLESSYPEYVISSVHCFDNADCYSPGFFDKYTRSEAINAYLTAVLESVSVPYRIDAVGHLGYLERVMPYKDKRIRFEDFSDILGKVFDKIKKRELILEVNTSPGNAGTLTIPSVLLLKAYYDFGGRLITTSSDAHYSSRVANNFESAQEMLKGIGFKHLYVKQKGQIIELGI